MDFNVNVKLDATPALVGVVSTLAKAICGEVPQVSSTVSATEGTVDSTPALQTGGVVQETGQQEEEITMEKIRALTAQKGDKRAEMKAILKDMGVDKIPDLPKEKYLDFYTRVAAL